MYLNFKEQPNPGKKTKRWEVVSASDHSLLGWIEYRPGWRRYVASFAVGAVFDSKCLTELSKFLDENRETRQ